MSVGGIAYLLALLLPEPLPFCNLLPPVADVKCLLLKKLPQFLLQSLGVKLVILVQIAVLFLAESPQQQ